MGGIWVAKHTMYYHQTMGFGWDTREIEWQTVRLCLREYALYIQLPQCIC